MKRILTFFTIAATVSMLMLAGCSNAETGAVTLNITDAPLEDETLTGVWITITGIDFHTADGLWQTYEGSLPDEPFNLMLLSGGATLPLGTGVALPAGQYNQIRFLLDIAETSGGVPTTPGCYLTFDEDGDGGALTPDVEYPLFVPSGDTSGYKAVKAFTVPVNGTVTITTDFDLRKAIVDAGTSLAPHYILKPTIRLVVDGEAGWIHGSVSDIPPDAASVVTYAYADGTWVATEDDDPIDETASRFPNAITSVEVCTDPDTSQSSYKLAFLAAGIYDVAVATFDVDGNFLATWGFYRNVEVIEGIGVVANLDSSLSQAVE